MLGFLKSFGRGNGGNVATIFAIALIPVLAAAGAAVDFTNGFAQREVVQSALDAAAVAANRINGIETEAQVRREASDVFAANLEGKAPEGVTLAIAIEPGKVSASTVLVVDNFFLGIVGFPTQTYHLSATSEVGSGTFEVVLVLDNSGSMAGSKISTLRTAVSDLAGVLFEGAENSNVEDPVKVGIVPFSRAVNVGPAYANATWMDTAGVGTYHNENFDEAANRFDLFDEIGNVSWAGCVEMRPYPNDVEDTVPTAGNASSLFVPYFAPDEPDSSSYYSSYGNNYISDTGGSCTSGGGWGGWWGSWGGTSLTDPERQARVCKYDDTYLSGTHNNGINYGPNIGCTANPLLPMTTSETAVNAHISNLKAEGMTNITAGVMWGWRLLSPGEPFTEGRPYGTEDNTKVLIVMTDGANTYVDANNFNASGYGAWGYVAKNHLGTTSTNNATVVGKMNERTLQACGNLHETDIRVYTVAFQLTNEATRQILRDCASDPEMAFDAGSNAELLAVFERIGTDLSELRLAM